MQGIGLISNQEIPLRPLTAAIPGAVIGVNRGRLEWAAGLRIHMLVCVGAALAVIVSRMDSVTHYCSLIPSASPRR